MNPGNLDQRVRFYRKDQTQQADGTLETTWTLLAEVWAEVKPKTGNQRSMAQQTENPADFEITVRNGQATREVTGSDIVEWRGHRMNITWAPPASPRQMYLHMDAQSGVAV